MTTALYILTFVAGAAYAVRRQGWWPAIRRHPLRAILIAAGVFAATLSGGTKGTNEPPPIVPAPTNIVLRFYWHAPDGRLFPIDALLKDIQP